MSTYGSDIVIWAIASKEDETTVQEFVDYFDIDITVLLDTDGTAHAEYTMASAFPTAAYPQQWLIGSDGNIAYLNNRYEFSKLSAAIDAALAE